MHTTTWFIIKSNSKKGKESRVIFIIVPYRTVKRRRMSNPIPTTNIWHHHKSSFHLQFIATRESQIFFSSFQTPWTLGHAQRKFKNMSASRKVHCLRIIPDIARNLFKNLQEILRKLTPHTVKITTQSRSPSLSWPPQPLNRRLPTKTTWSLRLNSTMKNVTSTMESQWARGVLALLIPLSTLKFNAVPTSSLQSLLLQLR